jgi:hypothetical protein
MPGNVRKNDKARLIALNILGTPPCGLTDKYGNKKRYVRRKEKYVQEEEKINRFQEAGYR